MGSNAAVCDPLDRSRLHEVTARATDNGDVTGVRAPVVDLRLPSVCVTCAWQVWRCTLDGHLEVGEGSGHDGRVFNKVNDGDNDNVYLEK